MSYLAIKGHATRGNEIIEILEMLGGKNDHYYSCNITDYVYGINRQGIIDWNIPHPDSFLTVFTLEEFFEKYPYKVEDKVNYVKYNDEYPNVYTIQGMRWTGATIEYLLDSCGFSALTKDLQPYKEETMDRKYNVEAYLKVWEETEKGLEVVVNDRFELKEKMRDEIQSFFKLYPELREELLNS